ncbi:MAG TPA: ATP synthase F1 subunit epsilon [Stellaceae bacterium]|jgi:F-type H+-transporting ATPase subunit epsilon|nr:ATP synthase F1 subunit epsilon [Stellaceae bacterium]
MADKVKFELVSPEKLLLSEEVAMVVVPGSEGNFGVLPGHALLISTVRPGIIDVYGPDQRAVTQRLFVSGGFAEVSPERCTVLADEAMPVKDIDRATVEGEAKALESEVAGLKDEIARAGAEEKPELLARLRASERRLTASRAKLEALKALPH